MKRINPSLLLVSSLLLCFPGCRQRDFRTATIDLPGLSPLAGHEDLLDKARNQIYDAFSKYDPHYDQNGSIAYSPMSGVELDSIRLEVTDSTNVQLKVDFDSLQTAEMNIVRLLDSIAITDIVLKEGLPPTNLTSFVSYPELKEGAAAGYINDRKPEVSVKPKPKK